jgi:hypothetical protein
MILISETLNSDRKTPRSELHLRNLKEIYPKSLPNPYQFSDYRFVRNRAQQTSLPYLKATVTSNRARSSLFKVWRCEFCLFYSKKV